MVLVGFMHHLPLKLKQRPELVRDGVTERERGRDVSRGESDDRLGRMVEGRKVQLSKKRETKDEKSQDVGSRVSNKLS